MTKEQALNDLLFELEKTEEDLQYHLTNENYEKISFIKGKIEAINSSIKLLSKLDGDPLTKLNYTRPNDPDHEDDPKEWLNSALIYARGLSLFLEEGEGVVVDLHGEMENPYPEEKSDKVITYLLDGLVYIDSFNQDAEEGSIFKIIDLPGQN